MNSAAGDVSQGTASGPDTDRKGATAWNGDTGGNNKTPPATPGAQFAAVFKALGDPIRIRLYHLLSVGSQPLCVCELVDALGLPQYQVSRHMRVLKQVGLVGTRRDGTWVYHSALNPEVLSPKFWAELRAGLVQNQLLQLDYNRLDRRLRLRRDGRCVVGRQESCDC